MISKIKLITITAVLTVAATIIGACALTLVNYARSEMAANDRVEEALHPSEFASQSDR